jgi:primosomal protein N' (replication factor Y)
MATGTIERARDLRQNATEAERKLWQLLRSRHLAAAKFRRQHPIGPFIADFACPDAKLIVEADGGQHAESDADERRTAWLQTHGWRVCRFWNNDILGNPEGVLLSIQRSFYAQRPHQR